MAEFTSTRFRAAPKDNTKITIFFNGFEVTDSTNFWRNLQDHWSKHCPGQILEIIDHTMILKTLKRLQYWSIRFRWRSASLLHLRTSCNDNCKSPFADIGGDIFSPLIHTKYSVDFRSHGFEQVLEWIFYFTG